MIMIKKWSKNKHMNIINCTEMPEYCVSYKYTSCDACADKARAYRIRVTDYIKVYRKQVGNKNVDRRKN